MLSQRARRTGIWPLLETRKCSVDGGEWGDHWVRGFYLVQASFPPSEQDSMRGGPYKWNVLVYPTLTHRLDLKTTYIRQKAADKPGQGNTFQLWGPPVEDKCWKGMMSSTVIFFLCTLVDWESFSCLWSILSWTLVTHQYSTWAILSISFPLESLQSKPWPHPSFVLNSELAKSNFTLWLLFFLIDQLKF